MIQRERDSEGDEFADKEAFVTQAYKDQLAEMQRAEEEERQREGSHFPLYSASPLTRPLAETEKKKNKGTGSGMAHFYRKLLEESEQQHEETVAAATTTKPAIGPQGPNLTITKPLDFVPKSDLELAKVAKEQGKDVELNDDNQIVDKRELLSAGLNLSAPNTRKFGLQTMKKNTTEEQAQVHRAVGTAASRREINERRAQEVARQMEEERERLLKEKEQREQESINRVVAKRNTEESVKSARERYLERKRRKVEEVAANPEAES